MLNTRNSKNLIHCLYYKFINGDNLIYIPIATFKKDKDSIIIKFGFKYDSPTRMVKVNTTIGSGSIKLEKQFEFFFMFLKIFFTCMARNLVDLFIDQWCISADYNHIKQMENLIEIFSKNSNEEIARKYNKIHRGIIVSSRIFDDDQNSWFNFTRFDSKNNWREFIVYKSVNLDYIPFEELLINNHIPPISYIFNDFSITEEYMRTIQNIFNKDYDDVKMILDNFYLRCGYKFDVEKNSNNYNNTMEISNNVISTSQNINSCHSIVIDDTDENTFNENEFMLKINKFIDEKIEENNEEISTKYQNLIDKIKEDNYSKIQEYSENIDNIVNTFMNMYNTYIENNERQIKVKLEVAKNQIKDEIINEIKGEIKNDYNNYHNTIDNIIKIHSRNILKLRKEILKLNKELKEFVKIKNTKIKERRINNIKRLRKKMAKITKYTDEEEKIISILGNLSKSKKKNK